jgi:hypothetical protein
VNANYARKQQKIILLDIIATHVLNLWLIVVLICVMIGIDSKCMLREFNDAVIDGKCRGLLDLFGKVFLQVAVCNSMS